MKTQHTPGPWHVTNAGQSTSQRRCHIDAESLTVAEVYHLLDDPQEATANAYLLAAAPGLLHTLAALVALRDTPEAVRSLDHACAEGRLWGTARALITQVTSTPTWQPPAWAVDFDERDANARPGTW